MESLSSDGMKLKARGKVLPVLVMPTKIVRGSFKVFVLKVESI